MISLHTFVLWFCCLHFTSCSSVDSVRWPAYYDVNDFRNMMLMKDGEHLIISGLNGVYNLNATDFKLLNKDNTSIPNGDDEIMIMFYTEINGKACITTCSSTRDHCDIRETENITMTCGQMRPPIKIGGVAAFMATYDTPGSPQKEFLFVGCPHNRDQDKYNNRCKKPGIAWYENGGPSRNYIWYGFKSFEDTGILTEKYLEAFMVDKFRIFFSLQKVKSSNEIRSRIAQVCQYSSTRNQPDTTPLTYADMPLECGDLKVIQAVKKITVGEDLFFIVAFSETTKSAVCVYTMENIKKKFVENIKLCYRGMYPSDTEDYIHFPTTSDRPCKVGTTDNVTLHQDDEYFLCNPDALQLFHQVIGNRSMNATPAIQYSTLIKSITVTVKDSKIIAFIGMANGNIVKAVVYPTSTAVQQPRVYDVGYGIKRDMYTSLDERHIFVLTQRQVFKLPVETCTEFSTCSKCIGSKDPYCGWCYLEDRCSIREKCTTSGWISAFDDRICPDVRSIFPEVMSNRAIQELSMNVSRSLNDVDVTCMFHSDDVADFQDRVSATVFENGLQISCKPRDITPIINEIKEFTVITVSISTNLSDAVIMSSLFTIYKCETFDRCFTCTNRTWTCKWCTYRSQCLDKDERCDSMDYEVPEGQCPKVDKYIVETDDDGVRDSNRTVYLSRDKDYEINITGIFFPEQKNGYVNYTCRIVVSENHTIWLYRTTFIYELGNSVLCQIGKEDMSSIPELDSKLESDLELLWGMSPLHGTPLPVIIYKCENLVKPDKNCGQCKSFETYQSYLQCKWCENKCVDSESRCDNMSSECGDPKIMRVNPLSAHINATTFIELEGYNLGSMYSETIDAVTIAGLPCESVERFYVPGRKISCQLSPSYTEKEGTVNITLSSNATGYYPDTFYFRNPIVTSIEPKLGPQSGGTIITLEGNYLETGREKNVTICGKKCRLLEFSPLFKIIKRYNDSHVIGKKEPQAIVCKTSSCKRSDTVEVKVQFDGADVELLENVSYRYVVDPNITDINPKESFQSGGRELTIRGTNLYAIQKPSIYAQVAGERMKSVECKRDDKRKVIYCPSPAYNEEENRSIRNTDTNPVQAKLGFEMDDVSSVSAENLPDALAVLMYFPDPVLKDFTEVKDYRDLRGHLMIEGERLNVAADEDDVIVMIGCERCNVTSMTNVVIYCDPPVQKPACGRSVDHKLTVKVKIGFLERDVGVLEYDAPYPNKSDEVTKNEYIIAGSIVGFLVVCLLATFIVVCVMWKKRKHMKREKAGLEYKMDKLEAKFRNQCREEFAALQTAVSDLTSDLEGGFVLFRDYDVYACKTLLTSHKTDALMSPPTTSTEQSQQALDTFKGLLRNRQFLLMLIKTLEKQNSFTIHDRSNVATILMVLNHDNMEYITGILTTLLNELIDKNVSSGTPKLLLRRSECVAEKLLTHWLSICLYHYLKERAGSALYILYKAIKIQTEKGPIDYISNCGKYTLSEDKLITSADTEINSVTLTLEVKHFDYIDNIEKQINVQVLDCDTITQAKNKMLDILYKNVSYSQRPAVHSTSLEIVEEEGGSKILLCDEDASSVKEGIWKKINTLQHYNIRDGTRVNLFLDREMEASFRSFAGASPDSYIVGSVRRSKPIVRTISGSNFWHLTKRHQTEDDVQLSSDLFLPRLLNTKGTLQTYIDDLFEEVLSIEEEPPLIVKYLFDFLDSAASRCGISDSDVLHTWKCNSLLLRFWVNIIKNPEFVFDIHKPHIVDSCLSVVAQTLMDSCSTADLVLGPSSPSNKLLFAKDIPRYKAMVRQYFQEMKLKPAVSDQDLNSYLTQKVSQKFSGKFYQSAAVMEMYEYTSRYRKKICDEMDNLEASSPGSFSPLTSKLQYVFMCMDMYTK